jgi:Protein kinase domain
VASKFGEWYVVEGPSLVGGGQGDVFLVSRKDEEPLHVLKRLRNPNRRGRFEREVETMRTLAASGVPVPEVVAEGVTTDKDAKPFYVMRFYEAGSLQAAVDDSRYVDDYLAGIDLLRAVARALAEMHACGCAHRDIKPANVLLGDDVKPVLADFGLALTVEEQHDEPRLTESTEAVGSRLYIAPENESGFNPEVDQRPADCYAFAKLAWAVLAGADPPARELQTEHGRRLATITRVSDLSRLDALFAQLLVVDPRARLSDWEVVVQELAAADLALPGDTGITTGPPAQLQEIEAIALRYAGSQTYLRSLESREQVGQRMIHLSALRTAVSDAVSAHDAEFDRVSKAAGGMEVYAGPPGTLGAASLRWLGFDSVLNGVGRYGQPGWRSIPGAEASVDSGPLGVVLIADHVEGFPRDPTDFQMALCLFPYIEDWSLWLVQIPLLKAGAGDLRLPPFLGAFQRSDGPVRPAIKPLGQQGGYAIGRIPAVQFETADVLKRWVQAMRKAGVSATTEARAWKVLSSALSWAVEDDNWPLSTNGCLTMQRRRGMRRASRRAGTGAVRRPASGKRRDDLASWALSPLGVERIRLVMLERLDQRSPCWRSRTPPWFLSSTAQYAEPGGVGPHARRCRRPTCSVERS